MSRKIIIFLLAVLLALFVGINIIIGVNSSTRVTFTSTYPKTSLKIISPDGKQILINTTQAIDLKIGDYQASYQNKDLNKDSFLVSIKKTTSKINLDPGYNNDLLTSKMSVDKEEIKGVIGSLFKSNNYSIGTEKLYHKGEWFAGSLIVYQVNLNIDPELGNPDNYDIYYVVLKKNLNNNWDLVGGPGLILTKPENPSIPDFILDDLNPSN